jgi:MtN3 and saliva related transmembrane protein
VSVDTVLGLAAAVYGVVMALSPVLQIRRMFETRSSADVSVGYFAVICAGFVIWIAYGTSVSDPVLIVPNSVALTVGVTTIAVARRFRDGPTAGRKPN